MSTFYQIVCLLSFVTAFPSRRFVDSVVTLPSTGRCPPGRELTKRECRWALPNNDAFATWKDDGTWDLLETCGCFIDQDGERYFNHFKGACDSPGLGQKMICKEHNPMDTCNDHTRIDGSFTWSSCDHDNTYKCDDQGRATGDGTHCCCENGFEPNEHGHCIACNQNNTCQPSQEWKRVCADCRCPEYDELGFMDIDACKSEAETHGYDYISWNRNNNKCGGSYENDEWCNDAERRERDQKWETHKITVEKCQTLGTTVWTNMKGFDRVCSKDEYSIKIKVDLSWYAEHDNDFVGEDCKTLCESVGSVCLGGWSSNSCPSPGARNGNWGCSPGRDLGQRGFVCECAAITSSGFVLIDGNPRNGGSDDPTEIFNPDPYQDVGEVQCCHSSGKCTRRNPWDSGSNDDCMSGRNDGVKYSLHEAISMCHALGDGWSLCTREESDGMCAGKGCGIDFHFVWAWDPNMIQASKVINYDDCTTIDTVTGPPLTHGGADLENWNTRCPENTAIVSVETMDLEAHNQHWTIAQMKCCPLVDKITGSQYRIPELPEGENRLPNYLRGGGSSSVEDQWEAQCPPNAVMVGIYDDDDSGDFDDIDATMCNALDCPYTCGEKIDNDDCVVVNLSPASLSSCPIDYVMVGLWDDADTAFNRVRKMKCCRVLESILPTVSPTQMPTTDDPSECPTVSPTTSVPSMSPTTDEPTLYPSQNPTTEQPTDAPSLTPSTEPTKFPSTSPSTEEPSAFPTTEDPSLFPTMSPSTDSPTKSPSQNPTTEEPTAFPSTPPTYAPTLCEPTCRSHADQLVIFLDLMLDFNAELLERVKFRRPSAPLQNTLNEMIMRLDRLKDQMNIAHDDVVSIFPPVH